MLGAALIVIGSYLVLIFLYKVWSDNQTLRNEVKYLNTYRVNLDKKFYEIHKKYADLLTKGRYLIKPNQKIYNEIMDSFENIDMETPIFGFIDEDEKRIFVWNKDKIDSDSYLKTWLFENGYYTKKPGDKGFTVAGKGEQK